MNIRKKWGAAAASVLAVTLVGAGTGAANAAPGDPITNPQSNGSGTNSYNPDAPGTFYIFDANGELAEQDGRVFDRADFLFPTSAPDDVNAEIDPDDYAAPGSWNGVYKFIAKPSELTGGTGSWRAFSQDAAAGPNGGVLQANLTLGDMGLGNNGGVDSIFAADGDWLVGLAFTTNNGVTPVGMVYRTVHIDGDTDTYTYAPIEYDVVAADKIEESELTGTETAPVTPTVDSKQVSVNAGAAHANQTLTVGAFSNGARVELGTATFDATGVASVDATAIAVNQVSKLFVYSTDVDGNEILAGWGAFTLSTTQLVNDTTALTVDVTASGKFSIVAPAAQSIDLGDVRRNRVTSPVALGAVTVFDDRDVLSGWNLNISSTAFAGPGNTSIAATALGYAPTGTTVYPGITASAAKLAGEGAFGTLAEGAAGSATGEFDGAVIDTNLTFKAPINAAKGTHTATLTLDLVSK